MPLILIPIAAGGALVYLLTRKKKGLTPSPVGPGPNSPRPIPSVPTPLPYRVSSQDGEATITIDNAFGTYRAALALAEQSGATPSANGEDVLRILASSVSSGVPVTQVIVMEPERRAEQWVDLLSAASGMTWSELQASAEAWMQEKGVA